MLLWEEYRDRGPGGYQYSRWCELYRAWEGRLSPTMRQSHPAGERLFVDYAGQTVDVIDPGSGEVRQAQIPVDKWHDLIGQPTLADAILDRIIHNAHRLQLNGDSLRKEKAPKPVAA